MPTAPSMESGNLIQKKSLLADGLPENRGRVAGVILIPSSVPAKWIKLVRETKRPGLVFRDEFLIPTGEVLQ